MSESKKWRWFSRIETREEALKIANEMSLVFFAVAAILAIVSFVIGLSVAMLIDAALYGLCGLLIRLFHSRIAAGVALLLALVSFGFTFANWAGASLDGGRNIVMAMIVLWAGIRAADSTLKIHGKFALNKPPGIPTPRRVLNTYTPTDDDNGSRRAKPECSPLPAASISIAASQVHLIAAESKPALPSVSPDSTTANQTGLNVANTSLASATADEATTADAEASIYAAIGKELESGGAKDIGTWTKAFAQANGDDTQTRVAYIKLRFDVLMSAEVARIEARRQQEAARKLAKELERARAEQEHARAEKERAQRMSVADRIRRGYAGEELKALNATAKAQEFLNACMWGRTERVSSLLSENPYLLGVANETGDTGLHIAVRERSKRIVKILIDAGADSDAKNQWGQTPLGNARTWRLASIVEILEGAPQAS